MMKSMIQPTLKEFIHNRKIKKHSQHHNKHVNLLSISPVLPPGKYNYSRRKIDSIDDISSLEMTIDSTYVVDLCTSSPPSSVGALSTGKKSPIPRVLNHLNDNLSEINMDVSSSSIRSPVLLEGFEMYDYMLTDAIHNLHISSSPTDELLVDPSIDLPLENLHSDLMVDKADFIELLSCENSSRHVELSTSPK
ncbi:hypothetical protein ZOSMA_434G00010 [Zostera marina]|uniref:Uncharacterized protein n=1 Tax=Zostera marina TaxID=29655 RepID=A0A0K9P408_ZOSMR|nr:hypothetical protein ZOSMA_434G00010 [Zostera marina]